MFTNECLGGLTYESTAASIVMAGIFLSFLVDYIGQRYVQYRSESKETTEGVSTAADYSNDTLKVLILEAGIIFHSLRKCSLLPFCLPKTSSPFPITLPALLNYA
jgi:zinc transporter 1/2/3